MVDAAKLPVETGVDPMRMAQEMFGAGIKIVDASYQGDPASAGIYSDADSISPGVAPSDSGVILSTGHASDVTNATGSANHASWTSSNTLGVDGDAQLNGIAHTNTFDGAIFSARFIPLGSTLTMQVTFSSEEYMEYAGSGFNDAVGVWVNGEKARLTVGDGDIAINNINAWSNSPLYIDNADGSHNTEMDGFTVTLTLKAHVTAGQVNDIRIGIADGGDALYDSNLMVAGHSLQTEVIAADDYFEVGHHRETMVNLTGNDADHSATGLYISQINGVDVHAGSHVMLSDGTEIVVNGDGTITVMDEHHDDHGDSTFSYEVTNGHGITDVGFVHGHVACFVAGARIATAQGLIAVEALRPGDQIVTLDSGMQTLRWCGHRTVVSQGAMAAVSIPAGTFGDHGALRVSPQHRLLMSGWRAELYCGEDEVLVRAGHLVRAGLLRQDNSGGPVTYYHLLFDRHEIINAEGLWSESYLPGPQTLPSHDPETQAELYALFPELETDPAAYGLPARPEAGARAAALLAAPLDRHAPISAAGVSGRSVAMRAPPCFCPCLASFLRPLVRRSVAQQLVDRGF
jgi:hypothetical protein